MSVRLAGLRIVAALGGISLLSCSDGTRPSDPAVEDYVAGDAALALGADGQFVLAPAPTTRPDGLPMLAEAEARAIAHAFPAQFWDGGFGAAVAQDRGEPVALASLRPCGRPFFALSALEPAPAEWDPVARRLLGERWLFGFCTTGEIPAVHVAVSAHALDLAVVDGRIEFPLNTGAEVDASGVPRGWQTMVPWTPEGAVIEAGTCLDRKTTRVPELLLQPIARAVGAKWRLALDQEVTVRGLVSGRDYTVSEVYAGIFVVAHEFHVGLGVATPDQPASVSFELRLNPPPPFEPPPPDYVPIYEWTPINRLPDRPIAFEAIGCVVSRQP